MLRSACLRQPAMDVELWKNCNFVSCPNLGSYFCQTAYNPNGWPQPTAFAALTQSSPTLANAHYTLGAQLEAKATIGSQTKNKSKNAAGDSNRRKAAEQDFRDALEQYRIAHQLDPKDPTYKSAYERLSRKLARH